MEAPRQENNIAPKYSDSIINYDSIFELNEAITLQNLAVKLNDAANSPIRHTYHYDDLVLSKNSLVSILRCLSLDLLVVLVGTSHEDLENKKNHLNFKIILTKALAYHNDKVNISFLSKHHDPLVIFEYEGIIFPRMLYESSKTLSAQLINVVQFISINEYAGDYFVLEINLHVILNFREYLKKLNFKHNFYTIVDMFRQLQREYIYSTLKPKLDEKGINLNIKSTNSLLDKLIYRQKDIHDLTRMKITSDQFNSPDGIRGILETQGYRQYGKQKDTKNKVKAFIFFKSITFIPTNRELSIHTFETASFVEVQIIGNDNQPMTNEERIALTKEHVQYEIDRLEFGTRYFTPSSVPDRTCINVIEQREFDWTWRKRY